MKKILLLCTLGFAVQCGSAAKTNSDLPTRQTPSEISTLSATTDRFARYDSAKKMSVQEFKRGFTQSPKGFNIIYLNSNYEEKGRFGRYNHGCFSIDYYKEGKPELYYVYEETFLARGLTEKIQCVEFSNQLKDCLLSFNLTSDTQGTKKGQVIFRVMSDTLYHIEPIGFPWDAKPQYGFLSVGESKKESWRNFKRALALYRKTPGLPELQSLGYKPEDIEFFDKTEEWEGY
jgi:hypothetical protein